MYFVANQKPKPLALLDLDGTLADFDGAMRRDLKALQAPGEPEFFEAEHEEEHPHMKARRRLIKSQPGWWAELPERPAGFEIVTVLRALDYRLHICTRGPKKNASAWTQKVQWCQEHIADASITITLDKANIYGRVLVDDWIPYVEPWLQHRPRGLVIMPDQVWNQGFTHPQVFRYIGGQDAMAELWRTLRDHDFQGLEDDVPEFKPRE
jgi:5'-nucleotidase